MKRCPFCAEEIQDAAIKCRYCGSMLTDAAPGQVSVPPPDAALDKEIKRLLGVRKKIDAIKLVRERKDLGLKDAKDYVEALEKGTKPELAAPTTKPRQAAPVTKPKTGRFKKAILWTLGGFFGFAVLGSLLPKPPASSQSQSEPAAPSVQTPPTPAPAAPRPSPAPATPSTVPAQDPALAESARVAVSKMVNLGLIKRMDIKTGKFYIDGPLWEGFELDAKENIVKVISGYREAEYKGLPQVTLYESRSGKELANYGAFSGVTIK